MAELASAARPSRTRSRSHRKQSLTYLGWRLVTYLGVGIFSVILNFALPRFMPGDPAEQMIQQIVAKTGRPPSDYQIAQIHERYGNPHEPIWSQFWHYLQQLSHFDFGRSIQYYPIPVTDLIRSALPWTLFLALFSTIIGWIIGTWAGARLGWRPGGRWDSVVTPLAMFFSSIPAFWLGILIVWQCAYRTAWFPNGGAYDNSLNINLFSPKFLESVAFYGFLPLVTLVLVGFAGWMFSMRNMMITTVNEDYVQLARAKGLSPRRIRTAYAARNALLPNFTGLAQSIGGSLTAVILAEQVFIYPGVGTLLGAAQTARDYPLMQTIMLLVIFISLAFNFIADSVYVLLDPRTREAT